MFSLGPLSFAVPWVLGALAVLPVIWWLLRITPPTPKLIKLPTMRFLRELTPERETTVHTPWWLLLLRMIIAALIIVGLSRPILNAAEKLPLSAGPVLMVVDNGWASAQNWQTRQKAMFNIVEQAERSDRSIFMLPTAQSADNAPLQAFGPMRPADARIMVEKMEPMPWAKDHLQVSEKVLTELAARDESMYSVWISDGFVDAKNPDASHKMLEKMQHMGGVTFIHDSNVNSPYILDPPALDGEVLTLRVRRGVAAPLDHTVTVLLAAEDGRILAQGEAEFKYGDDSAKASVDILPEIRNQITRISIRNYRSAATTVLLDERWRRRPVGVATRESGIKNQNYLSDVFYITKALQPFTTLYHGTIEQLLAKSLAVLALPDSYVPTQEEERAIDTWVLNGGVLLRFAGPNLARNGGLVLPVVLRQRERSLEGTMSWSEPIHVTAFTEHSPFVGLEVPDDVTVMKQILANPSLDMQEKTWAELEDGTPLITGQPYGDGHTVLIHTTADPEWSNLSMSGIFVEILRRIVSLSAGLSGQEGPQKLEPVKVLDGFGQYQDPSPLLLPIEAEEIKDFVPTPGHPPGLYGEGDMRRAFNLSDHIGGMTTFGGLPESVEWVAYEEQTETGLKHWLLAAALALAIFDLLLALFLRGLVSIRPAASPVAGAVALAAVMLFPSQAHAIDESDAIKYTSETYVAYVVTGDRSVDEETRAGLEGLSRMVARRTAAEIAGAVGVNPETDELAYFPFIYWPVTSSQMPLSEMGATNVQDYMANGGMILFDTRDQQFGDAANAGGATIGTRALRRLTAQLKMPPLMVTPSDHVLTRAFYLLNSYPGRYAGGQLWVEKPVNMNNDGVPTVLIGGNDWAGAWAGRPVVPGGERQREMAFRTGINMIMVALTGNYKKDQVHVKHILERLGQ